MSAEVAVLIGLTYEPDAHGVGIPVEARRTVFCGMRSVSVGELSAAGQLGYKPQLKLTMFRPDYEGEQEVEISGQRYRVYRTYWDSERHQDQIELYLESKTGV